MDNATSIPNLKAILRFPFQSASARNSFLIGTALLWASMFIPFLPALVVYGYVAQVMRRAIRADELALPTWGNWGALAYAGLRSLAIGAVYLGPGSATMIGGFLLYFTLWVGGFALVDTSPRGPATGWMPIIAFLAIGVLFLSMMLGLLLLAAGLIPLPAALARFVAQDRLAAAFDVGGLWQLIRADGWGYLLGWIVLMGLGGLAYLAFTAIYMTGILCLLANFAAIPFGFYMLLVGAVIFGQFYRSSLAHPSTPASPP